MSRLYGPIPSSALHLAVVGILTCELRSFSFSFRHPRCENNFVNKDQERKSSLLGCSARAQMEIKEYKYGKILL